MSLLFMDNFSNYGSGATGVGKSKNGVYADTINDVSFVVDPDGVSPGLVLACVDTAEEYIRKVLPNGAETTLGIAIRIWPSELPVSNGKSILKFNNASNSENLALQLNSTGTMSFTRGGTVIGTTSVPVVTANAWAHIEVKIFFDQAVGTAELRVNGVTKLALTDQDTCNTALAECSQFKISNGTNFNIYFKDLYVWNASGSVNNDFVGDVQVVTLRPDTDISLNWTPSTGTDGSDLIDESTPNDLDYISADSTPPAAFECTLTDLDSEVVVVKGLMMFNRSLKTDGGAANLQTSLVSNSIDADGSDRPITTAATYWMDIVELDPNTAAPWDPIAVNDATLKINRTL